MFLGGLWHGAGWTFVIWGLLHGGALVVNRLWVLKGMRLPKAVGWTITMLFLLLSWVIFRADDVTTAWSVWQSMFGLHGFELELRDSPNRWFSLLAFMLAVLGPTSQVIVQKKLKPRLRYALATAGLLFYLTLNVASDGYTEFIYFQF